MEPRRRRPPFRGYGVPEDEGGMLPWSWAAERLAEARNYWVSTTRPDGRPHSMPVWGIWLDDAFFFGSEKNSAKSRNLDANPGIVVHLESGDETVILEGHAEPVLDGDLERRVDEVYAPKYDWKPEGGKHDAVVGRPAAARLRVDRARLPGRRDRVPFRLGVLAPGPDARRRRLAVALLP